ncbi:MAG: hypothetical protein H0X42_05545 [Solirubrobacterales bacterium]|nr:hypothetical protein [Solirubrobacterales bacterium]
MGTMRGSGRRALLAFFAIACSAGWAPGAAAAANVVNGDFEAGNLSGWHVHQETEAGDWFAYRGTAESISEGNNRPLPQPPQGTFAAAADEAGPDSLILWQDIGLEPNRRHQLALTAYYEAFQKLAIPTPDTLSASEEALGGQVDQQFRIDVMKPTAPLESLAPEDILLTVFQTKAGDPDTMAATRITASLNQFAGQTVRLRFAVAASEDPANNGSHTVLRGGLHAGVDAISISNRPLTPSGQGGSGKLSLGEPRANRRNGTVTLSVHVPVAGRLVAKHSGLLKQASVRATDAGMVKIRLRPTATARKILKRKHRLRAGAALTFAPSEGSPEKATARVVLQLAPRPPRHR